MDQNYLQQLLQAIQQIEGQYQQQMQDPFMGWLQSLFNRNQFISPEGSQPQSVMDNRLQEVQQIDTLNSNKQWDMKPRNFGQYYSDLSQFTR